jgi:hypothetical protein
MSENVIAPTSRNPKSLHGLYRDNFTFTSSHNRTESVSFSSAYFPEVRFCDLHAVSLSVNPRYKKELRGLSLQANYTDRATTTCRRS